MKNLIYFILILLIATSCKKEQNAAPLHKPTVEIANYKGDSTSFVINGKQYISNEQNGLKIYNAQANIKLDSINKDGAYCYSGSTDSIMYAKQYFFSNISYTFLKKYSAQKPSNTLLVVPANAADLYSIGKYNYVVDFGRENRQSGIAIEGLFNGQYLTSYSTLLMRHPAIIETEMQKTSTFEIITFKKINSDYYIIEAKFNGVLFDGNEKPVRIENGYIRLRVS